MSTKAGGTDNLFLFTHANDLLSDMVFVLIFSIYLFIYLFIKSNVNKSSWKRRRLFTYENDVLSDMVFVLIFMIMIYLFIYLLKAMSTKAGGAHLFLFTYANSLLLRLNRCFLRLNYIKLQSKLLRFFCKYPF